MEKEKSFVRFMANQSPCSAVLVESIRKPTISARFFPDSRSEFKTSAQYLGVASIPAHSDQKKVAYTTHKVVVNMTFLIVGIGLSKALHSEPSRPEAESSALIAH